MQAEKFQEKAKGWAEKGDPPCDHPSVDKEYYLGSDTGDEGCTVCGATWARGHRPAASPTAALLKEKKSLKKHLFRALGWMDQLQGQQRPAEEWLDELRKLDFGDIS